MQIDSALSNYAELVREQILARCSGRMEVSSMVIANERSLNDLTEFERPRADPFRR
jgi:hypothetical protein